MIAVYSDLLYAICKSSVYKINVEMLSWCMCLIRNGFPRPSISTLTVHCIIYNRFNAQLQNNQIYASHIFSGTVSLEAIVRQKAHHSITT